LSPDLALYLCRIGSSMSPMMQSAALRLHFGCGSFAAAGWIKRRSAFLSAGGFEQRLLIGWEEQLLALDLMRAGWELAYVDAVVARHYPSRQRDPSVRSRLIERNRLWVTWLRRPLGTVVGQTLRALWQTGGAVFRAPSDLVSPDAFRTRVEKIAAVKALAGYQR
jgi:GT2 family glycosyltransferase